VLILEIVVPPPGEAFGTPVALRCVGGAADLSAPLQWWFLKTASLIPPLAFVQLYNCGGRSGSAVPFAFATAGAIGPRGTALCRRVCGQCINRWQRHIVVGAFVVGECSLGLPFAIVFCPPTFAAAMRRRLRPRLRLRCQNPIASRR
jgi:hypothetical protein